MSNAETPSPVHKLIDLVARLRYRLQHLKLHLQILEQKQNIIAHEIRGIKRKWDTLGADQDELAWNQLSNKETQDGTVETPNPEDSVDLSLTAELGVTWEMMPRNSYLSNLGEMMLSNSLREIEKATACTQNWIVKLLHGAACCPRMWLKRSTQFRKAFRNRMISVMRFEVLTCTFYYLIPVVPHKAVAEVSKIGNL
jgi:hypothetical protein